MYLFKQQDLGSRPVQPTLMWFNRSVNVLSPHGWALKGIDTLLGKATQWKVLCLPCQMELTLEGKEFLPECRFFSFRLRLEGSSFISLLYSLLRSGRKFFPLYSKPCFFFLKWINVQERMLTKGVYPVRMAGVSISLH